MSYLSTNLITLRSEKCLREKLFSQLFIGATFKSIISNSSIELDSQQEKYLESRISSSLSIEIRKCIISKILSEKITDIVLPFDFDWNKHTETLQWILTQTNQITSLMFEPDEIPRNALTFEDYESDHQNNINMPVIIDMLESNCSLKYLRILGSHSLKLLGAINCMLTYNKCLETLIIHISLLNIRVNHPMNFLQLNSHLKMLYLSTEDSEIIAKICESLNQNQTLESLDLRSKQYCCVSRNHAYIFHDLFQTCKLKCFSINNIDLAMLDSEIRWGLDHNQTLKELSIIKCRNNFYGIAEALEYNCTLEKLVLPDSSFGTTAAKLAEALHHNHTLKYLDISNKNPLYDDYKAKRYRALYEALCWNSSLQYLKLSSQSIDQETAIKIGNMLATRGGLQYLKLGALTKYKVEILNPLFDNRVLKQLQVDFIYSKDDQLHQKLAKTLFMKNPILDELDLAHESIEPRRSYFRFRRKEFFTLKKIAALTCVRNPSFNLNFYLERIPEECIAELQIAQESIPSGNS